ncbi:MAG: LAGLIDADG family homing endonuclease [Thaumarchaeota archaeon]|nr:LAGLIDADG family homing endonuclease [Nitrososphaerota archaeon]
MQVEHGEPKDSAEHLENFDIEDAIKTVRRLGHELIGLTAHAKHHFRASWVDQLVTRYRERPGKPIVHLSDLRDTVMPVLAGEARNHVAKFFASFVQKEGLWSSGLVFRNIVRFAREKGDNPAKLRSWREFSSRTGLDLNSLEPHVLALRLSGGRGMRIVKEPILPMNLATPAGGKLIGYRLDSNYSNSAFTNKNLLLHEDYRRAVTEVVGNITITETNNRGSGFKPDHYLRTNVGNLVTTLMSVAGLDISREQRSAWFFISPIDAIVAFLAAIWDAEGSVNKRDLKLRQAVALEVLSSNLKVPNWPDSLRYSRLDETAKEELLAQPPRILVSTALLLRKIGVICHVEPDRISNTNNGISAYWYLRVMRNDSVRTFHENIRLVSPSKEAQISENVRAIKWSWRESASISQKSFLT